MRIIPALVNLIGLCVPAAIAGLLSRRLARTSEEEWVVMAWVPPLPLLGFGIWVGVIQARDATAANLWPFGMAFFAVVTLVLFGLFLLARKLLYTPPSRWQRRDHGT